MDIIYIKRTISSLENITNNDIALLETSIKSHQQFQRVTNWYCTVYLNMIHNTSNWMMKLISLAHELFWKYNKLRWQMLVYLRNKQFVGRLCFWLHDKYRPQLPILQVVVSHWHVQVKSINQSINQWFNESMDEWISQSINKSNQSINSSIHQELLVLMSQFVFSSVYIAIYCIELVSRFDIKFIFHWKE